MQTDPQIKIRLKPALKEWVATKAKADDRSQAWLINRLIEEAMQREQKQAG